MKVERVDAVNEVQIVDVYAAARCTVLISPGTSLLVLRILA